MGASEAWVTDTRQGCLALQTILFAPNGPRRTVSWTLRLPSPSAVTGVIPVRLQSPGPVLVPFCAHSMT